MKLGLTLTELNDTPALLLDELLDIDAIYREVESDASSRGVDSGRERGGLPSPAGPA